MKFQCNKENIALLKDQSGLYFIYGNNDELLYIGQSISIKSRLSSHLTGESELCEHVHSFKTFDVKYMDTGSLEKEERQAIRDLNPLLNKRRLPPYTEKVYNTYLNPTLKFESDEEYLLRYVAKQGQEFNGYIKELIKEDMRRKTMPTQRKSLGEEVSEIVHNVLDAVLDDKIEIKLNQYLCKLKINDDEIPKYLKMLEWNTNGLKEFLDRED